MGDRKAAAGTGMAVENTRPTISRALALLDLFTAGQPMWTVERLAEALKVSAPTCYRYVRELVGVGLLMRLTGGAYALGPRIVLLDYTMRQADPLLRAAPPVMRDLTRRTGCDCVMSALYGDQILDTHRESGHEPLSLAYGRGRPRPLFRGGAPKMILAVQPARLQRKLYTAHSAEAAEAGMGNSWDEFRRRMLDIARCGHHVSRGGLEPQLSAVAVPVHSPDGEAPSLALALVTQNERFELLNLPLVTRLLVQGAEEISQNLASRSQGCPAPIE